jgi:hypothetical protein
MDSFLTPSGRKLPERQGPSNAQRIRPIRPTKGRKFAAPLGPSRSGDRAPCPMWRSTSGDRASEPGTKPYIGGAVSEIMLMIRMRAGLWNACSTKALKTSALRPTKAATCGP